MTVWKAIAIGSLVAATAIAGETPLFETILTDYYDLFALHVDVEIDDDKRLVVHAHNEDEYRDAIFGAVVALDILRAFLDDYEITLTDLGISALLYHGSVTFEMGLEVMQEYHDTKHGRTNLVIDAVNDARED